MAPAEAMRRRDAGEIEMIPPTWVTLLSLSAFATVAEALEAVGGREPDTFVTRLVKHDDGRQALLWAGDAGLGAAISMPPAPATACGWTRPQWRYERDFDASHQRAEAGSTWRSRPRRQRA